jgi:hypothetical protein
MDNWVKKLVEEACPSSMKIGAIIKHPDGRTVKIIDGQYWGTYGLSNRWEWREVLSAKSLGPLEKGYGW